MDNLEADTCGRVPKASDCYVSALGLIEAERHVLTIARLFFQSFARPASQNWMAAMEEAEAFFGEDDGPVVAARTLALLKVIRQTRRSVFMFNTPGCPGCSAVATEQERKMMTSLVAIREGDIRRARVALVEVCESEQVDGVMRDVRRLANTLCAPGVWQPNVVALH